MKSCAFFGHANLIVLPHREKILGAVTHVINDGVSQFYSGFRGDFDRFCSRLIFELKSSFPHIRNTMVLSYQPDKNFKLPDYFDDSVYLLDRKIPPRFAINETNRILVDKVDFIIAGVALNSGGAYSACEYARRNGKKIINVLQEK